MVPAGLMAQAGLFAAAAAIMTLVRQAIYAAILALGTCVGYLVVVVWIAEHAFPSWSPSTHPVSAAFVFIAPAAAALFVAWLAVQKDWGWKG
jgi:hypothetical protein